MTDNTDIEFAKSCERYRLVETSEEAHSLLESIDEAALDFETTALSPEDGRIRLTTICNDKHHFIIDHEFLGSFEEYVHHFVDGKKRWWVYNAKFETLWIDHIAGNEDAVILDVDFLKKVKQGGYPSKLSWMAKADLKIDMDKGAQTSDWSNPTLTKGQYDYAAFDGHVTWALKKLWWDTQLNDAQKKAFFIFNDSVRGTIECERTGLILDYGYHESTVELWKRKHATFERYIRKFTPESVIKNLNSDAQLGAFLRKELPAALLKVWPVTEKTKRMQMEGQYLRSVARRLPYPMSRWLAAVVGYKYYNKYLSTYGETLLTRQAMGGKVSSRFNIGQAATGRYSSSNANLQNIPRKIYIRKAFHSPTGGKRKMCLADYKGIEIRVLGELSGDEQLLQDVIYGDVHAASASQIYSYDIPYVLEVLESKGSGGYSNIYPIIKEQRSKAKGFTFQLLYGAGAGALSDVLRCSFDEASTAIQAWADRYSNAYNYRHIMFDAMMGTGYLPICDGRTVFIYKSERTLPVAANYPVQGAAASVMYRAVYHTHRLFYEQDVPAWLAATVHDELLSYAENDYAEQAMALQLKGMEQAWLDIFPGTNTDNLIDWKIGTTWADKP